MTLRHGFTTGTAAAAAAKAACLSLLGRPVPECIDVPLPVGERLTIPIHEIRPDGGGVLAAVVKDGGDDPDATHKAVIRAWVGQRADKNGIELRGGPGVGRVTKPGLPVAVGEAAINPAPRAQILQAVAEALDGRELGLTVEIRVDDGERLAQKTFNPRLGIVGGISILGTRGTVKPFSHAAYQATISQSLDVMRATGLDCPCLTTGGRSERFLRQLHPRISETACVQVADFFAFSMREVGRRGFSRMLWAVFFGKLVKQAQGRPSTHAHKTRVDLAELADWCSACGLDAALCARVAKANTALHALEEISGHPRQTELFAYIVNRATQFARHFAGVSLRVDYVLFDFSGRPLFATEDAA